uniref:CKLF like MARVEL transmembrane domain containing 5 n=1 Tax=Salvator merianae TaxID=96440 RepID=A0A8D0BA86_SALMN
MLAAQLPPPRCSVAPWWLPPLTQPPPTLRERSWIARREGGREGGRKWPSRPPPPARPAGYQTIGGLFSWGSSLLALADNPPLFAAAMARAKGQGLCFLVFLLLTASVSAYMGAALLEVLVTLAFLGLRATHYYERLTRVNWPCLIFSLILIAVFCFDAYKTYKAEMGSDQDPNVG